LDLGLDKSQWSRWYSANIEKNEFFIDSRDWVGFDIMSNGNETRNFAITIEFAKHIAMMAKTKLAHVH
jgi:anti-repressor protein